MSGLTANGGPGQVPAAIDAATEDQPRARLALAAALTSTPVHAYLLRGPGGTGKRSAARAFAAEILAAGSEDPADVRARVQSEPPSHPDLVWLRPPGAQHLVEDVRQLVIRGAAYRPVEGDRRVFVIESADALGDESQNALLKTLEEPPPFAHLLLVTSEPELLLETIVSRCQPIHFEPLPPDAVEARLAADGDAGEAERRAVSRLCGGDAARARFLLSDEGRMLRSEAEGCARSALAGRLDGAPWSGLLERAAAAGEEAADAVSSRVEAALAGSAKGREAGRLRRLAAEEARRVARRERTASLDLALELCAAWYRDVAAVASGAGDLVFNADRADALREDADGIDPAGARRAVELVAESRRRLELNVSEELALEALFYRLEALLG
jgi:DNA polymerase III subunit delta'